MLKIGIRFFENSFLLNFSFKMESLAIAVMEQVKANNHYNSTVRSISITVPSCVLDDSITLKMKVFFVQYNILIQIIGFQS